MVSLMMNQLLLFLVFGIALAICALVVAVFEPRDGENPDGLPTIYVIEPDEPAKWLW